MEINDSQFEQLPPDDKEHFLRCRICGEWVDRRDMEEIYDHLEHTAGTYLD